MGYDIQVHILALNRYVYPDITVVKGETIADTTAPIGVVLNPTLIIEILSSLTKGYDKGKKFVAYKTIPTFQEYLLIAEEHIAVTQWVKDASGNWQQANYRHLEDSIALVSVPVVLPVAQIYQQVNVTEV